MGTLTGWQDWRCGSLLWLHQPLQHWRLHGEGAVDGSRPGMRNPACGSSAALLPCRPVNVCFRTCHPRHQAAPGSACLLCTSCSQMVDLCPICHTAISQLVIFALQTPVQKYWKELLKYIEEGKLTPDMVSSTLTYMLHDASQSQPRHSPPYAISFWILLLHDVCVRFQLFSVIALCRGLVVALHNPTSPS